MQYSSCPGPPAPARFIARERELSLRQLALIERIRRSPVAEDYVRMVRENEWSRRNINETDCAMPFWNNREDPENVAAYPARLDADRRELEAAEAAFARVIAACKAG